MQNYNLVWSSTLKNFKALVESGEYNLGEIEILSEGLGLLNLSYSKFWINAVKILRESRNIYAIKKLLEMMKQIPKESLLEILERNEISDKKIITLEDVEIVYNDVHFVYSNLCSIKSSTIKR